MLWHKSWHVLEFFNPQILKMPNIKTPTQKIGVFQHPCIYRLCNGFLSHKESNMGVIIKSENSLFSEEKIGHLAEEVDRISSPLSDTISKDLKKRGMKFVGPIIIYAYLQAVGVINSHESGCFLNPSQQ